jgi:hypothetical protein
MGHRRKLNARGSMVVDPIIIDPRLMNALEQYMTINNDEVSSLVAKFLNLILNDSPYLEPYEVDNFILRNGRLLALWCVHFTHTIHLLVNTWLLHSAWRFYDVQQHEISSIRTSFLLRTLVVDSQPFQEVLQSCFSTGNDWEQR